MSETSEACMMRERVRCLNIIKSLTEDRALMASLTPSGALLAAAERILDPSITKIQVKT